MTRLFALLVVLAIAAPASANCTPGMLDLRQAWPADRSVGAPIDTHVLVHLYGSDEYLAQRIALELRGPSDVVALAIVADVRSGTSVMQQRSIVLRPVRALSPRTRYELHDVGPPPHGVHPHAFTTGDRADAGAPRAVAVTVGSFARTEFGCGPADEIPLGVRSDDDAREVAWVRLRIATSEAELRAGRFAGETILAVDDEGRASFGHGMCIGSWPLQPGQRLWAAASVLDGAMHEVTAGTIVLDAR